MLLGTLQDHFSVTAADIALLSFARSPEEAVAKLAQSVAAIPNREG
jgi:hypothetical protein